MGYHSSLAVTALLTLFNLRLGGWLGNPRHPTAWRRPGPMFGVFRLLHEMFGRTNARSKYVYLSDGGHFENLGVYELVRRRCRFIVACDAEQDRGLIFDGLGNLIRKCQTDFGIRIEVDVTPLRRQGPSGSSRWHGVVGVVHYEDVDELAPPGILVYLKSSLTGDEPSDLLNYAAAHPDFPHHPTANQFFTESQLESYRALGYHIGETIFRTALDPSWRQDDQEGSKEAAERLFAALQRQWTSPPPPTSQSSASAG